MKSSAPFEPLFSYGSLQQTTVQLATFGRTLDGTPEVLVGYRVVKIEIRDRTAAAATGAEYYLNAEFTGNERDAVAGIRFQVTQQELEQADAYEAGARYRRVMVQLTSGAQAWVYVCDRHGD